MVAGVGVGVGAAAAADAAEGSGPNFGIASKVTSTGRVLRRDAIVSSESANDTGVMGGRCELVCVCYTGY